MEFMDLITATWYGMYWWLAVIIAIYLIYCWFRLLHIMQEARVYNEDRWNGPRWTLSYKSAIQGTLSENRNFVTMYDVLMMVIQIPAVGVAFILIFFRKLLDIKIWTWKKEEKKDDKTVKDAQ